MKYTFDWVEILQIAQNRGVIDENGHHEMMTSSGDSSRAMKCPSLKALYLLKYMSDLVEIVQIAKKGGAFRRKLT